jgi:hypothetical protein
MPTEYKVLGQEAPAATTATALYTVPVSKSAVCSTLVIANRGVSTFFRVAVRPAGAALANKHYLVYDAMIQAGESVFLTLGITLAETDVLEVYAVTADVSFSLFGSEIS